MAEEVGRAVVQFAEKIDHQFLDTLLGNLSVLSMKHKDGPMTFRYHQPWVSYSISPEGAPTRTIEGRIHCQAFRSDDHSHRVDFAMIPSSDNLFEYTGMEFVKQPNTAPPIPFSEQESALIRTVESLVRIYSFTPRYEEETTEISVKDVSLRPPIT